MFKTSLIISSLVVLAPSISWAAAATSLADFASITGATPGQQAGVVATTIGDVNGDGYEDIAVSAPSGGTEEVGLVYIVYGRAGRIDSLEFEDLPTFRGEDDGDQLGEVVSGLGDVNADGYDDFALVSNHHDGTVTNPGTIYIVYGQAGTYSNQSVASRPRFYGEARGDGAGAAVGAAGDLNSDGYDDFAIGATWRDDYTGGVYIIYGQAADFDDSEDLGDYPLLTGDEFDYAGGSITGGDLTNDGVSDLIVASTRHDDGSTFDVGIVYLIPGRTSHYIDGSLSTFAHVIGTSAYEKIGGSIAVGDVNGDTYNDLVIGAGGSDRDGTNAGRVYVVLGQSTWPTSQTIADAITLTTDTSSDLFGGSVAIANDLNSDGMADILAGAPSEYSSETGRAFVTLGTTSWDDHNVEDDYPFTGEDIGDEAGGAVSTADLNGDGVDELVIAASRYGSDGGKVYIGYWPIYNCSNSVELGGILADYPTEDYKLRRYAENDHFKIAVERHGRHAYVLNCVTNEVVQTLEFNERVQRKILARVFNARSTNLFVAVTRTPSKRKIKVFLYQVTPTELVETDYFKRKWRPRGFRIKLNHKNKVVLQRGKEKKHRLKYQVNRDLTLTELES
jgi:hypothetical protein